MTPIKYFSIVCFGILAGCKKMDVISEPYIPNGELLESYHNFDESLESARSTLSFQGGLAANNCKSYFKLVAKHNIEETIQNQMVKSEYLICDALDILSKSSGVSQGAVSSSNRGEELLNKLDLRTFRSSLSMTSNEEVHTLKSLYPESTSFSDNLAELNADDWVFTLEVVAVTRINDNPTPDWVVWVLDESTSGNYRGYSTLIVYDPELQSTFKASTYP